MMRRVRSWLTRLARAEEGVSAVEFALIAPLMILFYFGLAELSQGYMAQRRVNHAAAAIADLVAQQQAVNNQDMQDIFLVGGLTMAPFPTDTLKLRISSVVADAKGVPKVAWSDGSHIVARTKDEVVTVPAGLIAAGASVIMAEVEYDYHSTAGQVMPSLTRLKHTYYLAPRLSQTVTRK
ncbi:TadE/TadG family type IV pilus assembly protein [Caulobacter sp. 17J80-11]|uniref:TadE/TadG family type IV pilus assembly protein n=1 Tax=Caulobacter sp. 17J80-11 TaxID=2763502 RepID=UPI001653C6C0|nr:TadE/TadG family type IV pilus assembly protein [Caulobacter sp. 17J80-11]MBC6981644.1 pilus assembly protein [Caulobacter sp. 17J80-11]